MNWIDAHRMSEEIAARAHQARREGRIEEAKNLFGQAGLHERLALDALSGDRPRTLGITAVSATALYYKAGELNKAEQLAHEIMGWSYLPDFAREQLRGLLQTIWNDHAKVEAGITFEPGQVLISVKGGQVVTGGAPLDLILSKVQVVQSLFYRTAELLKDIPLRVKGPPSRDVQEKYRPWLFHS